MTPIISVVICTYNRVEMLKTAVESVISQKVNSQNYELIIVDNNSRDETKKFVEQQIKNHKNMRYIFEDQQGLSFARNRGWREANGTYIAYIDDDCILPSGYLAIMFSIIQEKSPDIIGGPIIARYDFKKPHWVKDEYFSFLTDRESGWLRNGGFVYGGNMVFYKKILERLGGFDINLGMNGEELGFAEEIQIQQEAWAKFDKLKVYFSSELWLYHQTRFEKTRLLWQIHYYYTIGVKSSNYDLKKNTENETSLLFRINKKFQLCTDIIWLFVRIVAKMVKAFVLREPKHPYWQNYMIEQIFQLEILQLGRKFTELNFRKN